MNAHHQYYDKETGQILTERFYRGRLVRFLYSSLREKAPVLFRAVTSARMSSVIAFWNYDFFLGRRISSPQNFMRACGIDFEECTDDPASLNSAKKIFERRIRYWECRPAPGDPRIILSPADSRILVGSFSNTSLLRIKEKFFDYEEMFGNYKTSWLDAFREGDFAVFRLTPDKYHYNHAPVSGRVIDFYEIPGEYHSCHPEAVISVVTPYSKNKRAVTIIDTDVPEGTGAGLVAMIEIAALMIGGIVQCYSEDRYKDPRPISRGMSIRRGMPKSLYRPGSSTDVLVFQKDRIRFDQELTRTLRRGDIESRYSAGFGQNLAETDVKVRSGIALAVPEPESRPERKKPGERNIYSSSGNSVL